MNSSEFNALVLAEFPELAPEIVEDEGLPHLQMHAFQRYTERAIAAGDIATVNRCFALADRGFHNADRDLKNAFYVSFLEHLGFSGPHGAPAKARMSPLLQSGYKEIMDYMGRLSRSK